MPFLLINLFSSVLREDIHLWFWGDSGFRSETFEFFVDSILTLPRLFYFYLIFRKYLPRVYSIIVLFMVEYFSFSECWMGWDSHEWDNLKFFKPIFIPFSFHKAGNGGGNSRCCPGEFLAVDLSGGISRCRPDLSGGASFSSLYKGFYKLNLNFYVAFHFVLKIKIFKEYSLLLSSYS